MRIGLCLSGGGAKGAFQAGVIKGLYDNGINRYEAISGTSIGAVNGYYVFTDNVEKLEQMWTNLEVDLKKDIKIVNNTVDNTYIIEGLKNLDNNKENIDFYVNYIEIENRVPQHKIVNLSDLNQEECMDSIKYSSLLPFNPIGKLDTKEQFKKDLVEGLYDGYKLDGGLLKNTLIEPLLNNNLDKIILISMRYDYEFLYQLKVKVKQLREIARHKDHFLAHSVLQEMLIYLFVEESKFLMECMIPEMEAHRISGLDMWNEWAFDLFEDMDIVTCLYSDDYLTPDHIYHFDHWAEYQFHV